MNYKIKFIQLMMGQSISILGSSLTSFSLSLWVYEKTGEPSHLALLTFSYFCPMIYFSIFAGHFVDRFKRKIILLSCDLGLILASFLLLLLISTNEISILPLVCIIFVSGLFSCFKSITFQTTVSMFIDEKNLLKYNGFVSILQNIPVLLGPILGGILLSVITIKNIVLIDIITFLLSFIITLFIIFPDLSYKASKKFQWNQITFGTKYIFKNNTLKKILLLFSSENFFNGLTLGFITAFLLEKTNGDNLLTAYNSSLIALGGIIGGIITVRIAHLIHKPFQTILIGFLIVGFIGRICTGLAESIVVIGFFLMIRNILMPIINSSCELIWQKNTPKEYQGRVFGARRFFAQGSIPLSILIGTWALETIFPINGYLISLLSETIDQNIKTLQLSLFFIFCGFLETLIPLYYFIKTIINKILLRVR